MDTEKYCVRNGTSIILHKEKHTMRSYKVDMAEKADLVFGTGKNDTVSD
jgi:hypothetical protein